MENKDIKNTVDESVTYTKHFSFGDFLIKEYDEDSIKHRLKTLYENNKTQEGPAIQALNDLFGDKASASHAFKLTEMIYSDLADMVDEKRILRYLAYRYAYDVYPEIKHLADYPPCIQVEPTSICNYRCIFCYQTDKEFIEKKNGHMGIMPLDLFKNIIDELEGNVEAVTMASRGEPLVCKHMDKMLEHMGDKFVAAKMNTNAYFLDEKQCHMLLSSGLHTLVFSADAAEEELYKKLRVNGNLERVLKNVRQFKDIREKHYPDSKLITRVSGVKVNADQDFDSMTTLWGELVDQVTFVKYNPWENTYDRPENDEKTPCTDLWRRAFVWWDGKCNPCDVDYKSHLCVGNLNESGMSELWTGQAYQDIRQAHLDSQRNTVFPCKRCTFI